ncbi:MAG TPA: hypothetical protein VF796_23700 [Humisphaera sp.]
MTTTPIDYRAGDSASRGPSIAVLAVTALACVVPVGALLFSYADRGQSRIWAAWPNGTLFLHALGAAVVAVLGAWAVAAIATGRASAPSAVAALGRYAALFALVAVVCSWGVDERIGGDSVVRLRQFYIPLDWLIRLARVAVLAGVPAYAMWLFGRSDASRRVYGQNVSARVGDALLSSLARDSAVAILLMLAALLLVLFSASLPSMKLFGWGFLTSSEWRVNPLPGEMLMDPDNPGRPLIEDGEVQRGPPKPPVFGALPVIYGTAVSSLIALLVAVPLSFGSAMFLVRISPDLRPLTVRAAVAGLLIAVGLPAMYVGGVRGDDPNAGVTTGTAGIALGLLVVGIVAAEVVVRQANRMLGTIKAGQPAPAWWDLAGHGLVVLVVSAAALWKPVPPLLVGYALAEVALAYWNKARPAKTKRADDVPARALWLRTLLPIAAVVVTQVLINAAYRRPPLDWDAWVFYGIAAAILYPVCLAFTSVVSFLIEFLAAIPSIAYGIWGMTVLAGFLRRDLEPVAVSALRGLGVGVQGMPTGSDMLCGGLLLGIMIVPIITAISRDVLRAVPSAQIEGTTALGATWWESCWEMLVYSRSALFGAVILGLARAAGETMAVTFVIGNNPQIVGLTEGGPGKFLPNPIAPSQTMASLLANEFREANPLTDDGRLHLSALMYVCFILLVMSLTFNVIARYFVVGKGSRTSAAH